MLLLFFSVRWCVLYSSCSPEPTTSSALKLSLHPIWKYIILPIQICQGFYCICISNMIKSFSGLTFFLEGNFKLSIFFLVISFSLSSPTSLSDCKSPNIKREATIHCYHLSLPGLQRGSALHFQVRPILTENLLQAPWNIFIAQISHVDGCFCQMLPVDASYLVPKEGEVKRYIHIWVSGRHTSLSIFVCLFKHL